MRPAAPLMLSVALATALVGCSGADPPAPPPPPTDGAGGASLALSCPLAAADLSGLPEGFDPLDPSNDAGNLGFYVEVDLSAMDLSPDAPPPSAEVPSVATTPAVITVVDARSCTGETFAGAEVRYKGNTTFDKPKPQLKLSFSKEHPLAIYRKLNLHSGWKDATLFREKLAYDLLAAAGVVSPRANHALLWIRDTSAGGDFAYQGLYTLVEQVNGRFLDRAFGEEAGDGYLYKAYYGWKGSQARGFADLRVVGQGRPEDYRGGNGWADTYDGQARAYRLKTHEDEGMEDYADLAAFIAALDAGPVDEVFDTPGFVSWLAANTLLGGWDNYWLNAQNYYLYHSSGGGHWRWIPWDHDNTLGNNFQDHNGFHVETESIFYERYPANALTQRVLEDAAWRDAYLLALEALLDGPFSEAAFASRIAALREDLEEAARLDPLKQYSNDQWLGNQDDLIITESDEDGDFGNKAHHLGILDYVRQRSASVRAQIAQARRQAPAP